VAAGFYSHSVMIYGLVVFLELVWHLVRPQAEIMRVVNAARADGTLHTKDWATMSLIRYPPSASCVPCVFPGSVV
jgi:hypothetical protein